MTNSHMHVLTGQIVEEELALTLDELSGACRVEHEHISELVECGLLEMPAEGGRFVGASLRRARLALRLQRDLGINSAGAALVVELLDRIEMLEARVRAL
jgi:chaperone modulatory protein CbpM